MSYKIITDSGCDFTKEKYAELGLAVAPLMVNFRGESYPDRNDESLKDLYAGLRAGEVSTTAAVNPEQWAEVMEPVLKADEDVLVLAFSSGLSTSYQSAEIAAGDLREQYPDRGGQPVRLPGPGSACLLRLQKAGRGPGPAGALPVAAK